MNSWWIIRRYIGIAVVYALMVGVEGLLDLCPTAIESVEQPLPAIGVVEQVFLQLRVAVTYPNVA
ncbi:hypothetical protein [Ralstonia solanacearum]|uniref:hypothetical protein n=1 Tax=Ralstonia solanacearum TaxID=305 RepID=UPI000A10C212|nr:hypothetical protein [Ralstonia solanacearum]